jgi:hypothetical protein
MALESFLGVVPILLGGYFLIAAAFGRPVVYDAMNWVKGA